MGERFGRRGKEQESVAWNVFKAARKHAADV